jgi:hypothetical protein
VDGRIRSIKKESTSSGIRTGGLPACNIVPQPTTLPRAPFSSDGFRQTAAWYATDYEVWKDVQGTRDMFGNDCEKWAHVRVSNMSPR